MAGRHFCTFTACDSGSTSWSKTRNVYCQETIYLDQLTILFFLALALPEPSTTFWSALGGSEVGARYMSHTSCLILYGLLDHFVEELAEIGSFLNSAAESTGQ